MKTFKSTDHLCSCQSPSICAVGRPCTDSDGFCPRGNCPPTGRPCFCTRIGGGDGRNAEDGQNEFVKKLLKNLEEAGASIATVNHCLRGVKPIKNLKMP